MKVYEITESKQQLDEIAPAALLIPTLVTAIRVGGPRALGWLARKGAGLAGRGVIGAAKRPITTALTATGIAGYNALKDIIPNIPPEIKAFMGKYAIPAAAVLAVLYGGKKLYDYFKSKEATQTQESIDNNLKNFLAETTSAGGMGIATIAMPIGNIHRRVKKKKRKANG